MIISTHQPYFAPYCGFFQKARLADRLVVLDQVQFPQGTTWLSRNRFKHDQGPLWLTVPVWKKGLGLQPISQVRICHEGNWRKKHLAALETAYAHAPYLAEHRGLLDRLFDLERLVELNLGIIQYVMRCLEIDTELILLSELDIRLKGESLLLEICRQLGATTFLAQAPAVKYLNPKAFEDMGVSFARFTPAAPVYPQLWGDFIANLSVLDLLFNCGPKAREIYRGT